MLSIQEIQDVLNQKITQSDLIKRWKDVYYGMSLHIDGACPKFKDGDDRWITPPSYFGEEYQWLFNRILLNRHPRESEVTRNWRFSQYRPFTKSAFGLIIELIGGTIFQDTNYSLIIPNDADSEYIWGKNFNGHDIIQFFNWSLTHIMEDPNGYFVRIPKEPYYQTTTERIEPDIFFIWSKNIKYVSQEEIIFEMDRQIWVLNTVAVLRFKKDLTQPTGQQWMLDDKEYGGYYAHMLGYLPCDVAGGIWNSQGFYNSWLDKAKAIADDFIASKSAEQLIDKEASHPFITISSEDCPECRGEGLVQHECEECPQGFELLRCPKCMGKGLVSQNPAERMYAPPDLMDRDLIKITNPDISINKYLFDKNKELYTMLLDALNLLRIDEAQSGVAKIIDQERLFHFVSAIASDVFGRLIYNTTKDIIAYRNTTTTPSGDTVPHIYQFKLVAPKQFMVKTAQDLLNDYEKGTNSKIPAYIRTELMREYVDKQFAGDLIMQRKTDIIIQMDKISTYSVDEQSTMVANGQITQQDLQFSIELPVILDEIIRDKGSDWFLTATYDAIEKLVEKEYLLEKKPIIPIVNENTINQSQQQNTNNQQGLQ